MIEWLAIETEIIEDSVADMTGTLIHKTIYRVCIFVFTELYLLKYSSEFILILDAVPVVGRCARETTEIMTGEDLIEY